MAMGTFCPRRPRALCVILVLCHLFPDQVARTSESASEAFHIGRSIWGITALKVPEQAPEQALEPDRELRITYAAAAGHKCYSAPGSPNLEPKTWSSGISKDEDGQTLNVGQTWPGWWLPRRGVASTTESLTSCWTCRVTLVLRLSADEERRGSGLGCCVGSGPSEHKTVCVTGTRRRST